MGRKKGYEREELISSAFNVFHRLGYRCSRERDVNTEATEPYAATDGTKPDQEWRAG